MKFTKLVEHVVSWQEEMGYTYEYVGGPECEEDERGIIGRIAPLPVYSYFLMEEEEVQAILLQFLNDHL